MMEWLPVHAIELEADGEIRPHVDSVKFSGGFVAGLSLLSSAVMTLEHSDTRSQIARMLLPPRSLYVLEGAARYDFTHRIGGGIFCGSPVERGRRISLIIRDAKPA